MYVDPLITAEHAIQRLEDMTLPTDVAIDPRYYGYTPLPMREFCAGLEALKQYVTETTYCFPELAFLDVGCGIGTKLLAAQFHGFRVSGIEVVPAYADVARRLVPEANIAVTDAFDFTNYADFDVVYAYHPCQDKTLEKRLEEHIVSHMKPGAFIFLAGERVTCGGVEHIGDQVWRVI